VKFDYVIPLRERQYLREGRVAVPLKIFAATGARAASNELPGRCTAAAL
jgi:hypothetical protein